MKYQLVKNQTKGPDGLSTLILASNYAYPQSWLYFKNDSDALTCFHLLYLTSNGSLKQFFFVIEELSKNKIIFSKIMETKKL